MFNRLIAQALDLKFDDSDPVWQDARELLYSGGWRSGKTTRAAFRAFCSALDPSARLIWLIGPDYVQAQEEFRMIHEWALRLDVLEGKASIPADGQRSLRLITGCLIVTKSAQHPERLGSVAPDGIVMCEPGQMSSEVYDMALGRLAEKRGWLIMAGTLEDDTAKPRWAWYEDLATRWLENPAGSRERSFCIPTWSNKALYPEGLDDPELQAIHAKVSAYTWSRRYGGRPEGLEDACFPLLWEPGVDLEFLIEPEPEVTWHGGAIGVDYGRTFEHPSAIVVIQQDNYGRYWVRELWKGIKSTPEEIEGVVDAFKTNYGIYEGCVDPNQGYMGDRLGFQVALGSSSGTGRPTEMRITLANSLLEERLLFFDINGTGVREVVSSMRACRRIRKTNGELRFERPLGDDPAQALMYAIEYLRGMPTFVPALNAGSMRMSYQSLPSGGREGRI